MKEATRFNIWIVLGFALAVRLIGIASRPTWYDEAFAILFARQGPAAMIYGTLAPDALGSAADIHPLGYYTLLWVWMRIFGESIVAARMLSVFIGCGVVFFGFHIAKTWFGTRIALWTAAFLILSPFMVHYAQEIRMYGLLALFLMAASFYFFRALHVNPLSPGDSEKRDWVLFSLFSALAMYTHTLAVFYLLSLSLVPVIMRSRVLMRKTFLAGAAALALYSPWLLQIPGQLDKVSTSYWTAAPGPDRLLTTLLTFVANLPIRPEILPFALFAALFIPLIALLQTYKAYRTTPGTAVNGGLLMLYLAFAPVLLMFAVSQFIPVYIERALLPSGAAFLIWVAWALRGTVIPAPVRWVSSVVLFTIFFLGLQGHLTYNSFPYAPYASINQSIRDKIDSTGVRLQDVAIIHANKLSALPGYLDAPDLPVHFFRDIPGSGSDTLALPTQDVIGFHADNTIESAVGESSYIWFIVFSQELAEREAAGEAVHPAQAWLETQFIQVDVVQWDDLVVFEYEIP